MKKGKTKWIFIGLGGVCAVLVLFLLVLDAYGTKQKRFSSERFGYEVSFDESRYSVETVRLDERPTYMERVVFTKDPYGNYLGVSGIDSTADLDEILAAFQSDESYQFDIDEDVTIGKGYHARKISYTDTSGEEHRYRHRQPLPCHAAGRRRVPSGIPWSVVSQAFRVCPG